MRVVQLTPPLINTAAVKLSGTTLTIPFTDNDTDDTPASFRLRSETTPGGTYTTVTTATFTQNNTTGVWTATVIVPAGTKAIYYEIVRFNY